MYRWWFFVLFYSLEILSVFSTATLYYYTRILKMEEYYCVLIFLVLLFIAPQAILIIWFSKDCYSRTFNDYKSKRRWVVLIATTGFIGCIFYYFNVIRNNKICGK